MRLFLFYESDSFLHRLNPLTKLACALIVMLVATIVVDPVTPLVATAILLATILVLGRIPPTRLLPALAPFLVVAVGLFWTTVVFYAPDPAGHARVLAALGPVRVTNEAIAYGLAVTFRILAVFAASLLFILTTDPTDLVQALIQKLRLDFRFGYGALAAYRFVPLFESELETIRAAHRIRGVGGQSGPLGWYRDTIGFLIPLLAGGVRKADRVAIAMDARGFGAYPTRTYYRRSGFGSADLLFAVGGGLALVAVLGLLHALGLLGRLVPPFLA